MFQYQNEVLALYWFAGYNSSTREKLKKHESGEMSSEAGEKRNAVVILMSDDFIRPAVIDLF
jgi:hypothetical protein